MLTTNDLDRALRDPRHLGSGWAYANTVLGADDVANANDLIIEHANELRIGYEDLFEWSNSKHGRYLAWAIEELVFESDGLDTQDDWRDAVQRHLTIEHIRDITRSER